MGISDVEYVDVIADAGSVGGGIVRAEDFDVGDHAEGGVENFGNEMGFDAVVLAALGGGAGGVEIAESGEVEASVGAIVGEDFFEAEFGFALGVDGIVGMIFGDGDGVRFAVGGGGGGKDKLFYAVAGYGVKKIDAGGDVGGVERAGLADGLGDKGFACKMHDRVDGVFGEDFRDLRADAEIGWAENRFGRNGGGVALLKIIEGNDLVAAGQENFRANTADVARCSGDKNVQREDLAFFQGIRRAFAQVLKLSGWRRVVSGELGKERDDGRVAGTS